MRKLTKEKCRTLALLVLVMSVITLPLIGSASNIFLSPSGAGAQTGADCGNAKPTSFFNSGANWGSGAGQIGPDTIVHLCSGTYTTELDPQGNGAAGHPWILLFESGAQMVQSSWRQAFYSAGHSYWKIDGGVPCGWNPATQAREGVCRGVIKNSSSVDNNTLAIEVSGSHDWEVTNLEIGPLYIHTANTGPSIEVTLGGCIYANGAGVNGKVSHSYFHDVGWCVNLENMAAGTFNFVGDHMYMEHMSHFFQWGGCNAGGTSGYTVQYSKMHEPANWDTTDNAYHHDGIQVDPLPEGNSCDNFTWQNNVVDGDWGINNTSPIFLEQHSNENISHVLIINSTFAFANGHKFNNGAINAVAFDDLQLYNNTVQCPNAGIGIQISGNNIKFRNNVVSGCNTFIWANSISATSWLSDTNNVFGDQSNVGGNPAFIYSDGSGCCSGLPQWQTKTGGSSSSVVTSVMLNANGSPQTGSPVINASANLTSLTIAALNADLLSVGRPGTGPWASGAFSATGTITKPNPPIGLVAVPH
jgi:hypothetical protein